MRAALRALTLATGCAWLIGASSAQAQIGPAYYYPSAGDYATTFGTVHIPFAGYYFNVPLSAVPYRGVGSPPPVPRVSNPIPRAPAPRTLGSSRDKNDFNWLFKD